jgi:TolB-like protein
VLTLVFAVAYFAGDKFIFNPERVEEARELGRIDTLMDSYGDRSIVVLPFANLSSDPEQDFFADGMTEELLNLLARIKELRVISRTTAFSYKGQSLPLVDIAKELRVSYVLEGSVRKSGNRLRVTAQLIDARTDAHRWSQTFDHELVDIFAIQDKIATEVVAELQLHLGEAMPAPNRVDPMAYVLYK